MQSYSIGLSGLGAAQMGLDVIANNISNAATQGYHRQDVELTPAYSVQTGSAVIGGGVDIAGVTRMIDTLLEKEILSQQSLLGQVDKEAQTLTTVENTFGELSSDGGLASTIDKFFTALQDLAANPSGAVWQSQLTTTAENMTYQFRALDSSLSSLQHQISLELENTVEKVNTLIAQIGTLNDEIERIELTGSQANTLRDQRDQCISQLSGLVGVETQQRNYGVVDVSVGGLSLVTGTAVTGLQVGTLDDGRVGVSLQGAYIYDPQIQGGKLGGLLSLKNEILSGISTDLDTLANAIINQINQYHVQGVGSAGSFSKLTGWVMPSVNLADFASPVSDGEIYMRVTDTTTGQVTRYEINIDASSDSLTTIADYISNNVTGLTASAASSRLTITADATHTFDFLPAVSSEPLASALTAASPPTISVSGIYTGTVNDTLKFTVSGAGSVGNGNLQLEVKDTAGTGDVIATLNIGSGYAAGDLLNLPNGIRVAVGVGDFNAGDNFDVQVLASTDTSGLLAAIGMNTFFSGNSAANIAVCSDILNSPDRVATSLGADGVDNTNVSRIAALKDQALSALNSLTPDEFYRQMVTDIGQQLSIKKMRQDSIEGLLKGLNEQQGELSGVNINDEAAKMLVFEQMFQAMAKYMATVNSTISALMDIV